MAVHYFVWRLGLRQGVRLLDEILSLYYLKFNIQSSEDVVLLYQVKCLLGWFIKQHFFTAGITIALICI